MTKTVNILGTPYKVRLAVPYAKDPSLKGRFGYTSFSGKLIVVADICTIPGWEEATEDEIVDTFCTTIRHEVIHAYLMESGLNESAIGVDSWARNEEMVDWFAIQWPKILKTFEKLGCGGR
jgi:hypothetical protein